MRQAEGLTPEDFVILCTGELNENKNQKTLISAAAQLKDQIPNLKVLLAGNGPKEQELRDQIRSEGLEGIVRLLGYRTDLEKLVPAVDLVVSCSRREGMPLNIIEAMLCKKPVVASHNRGHDELIENNMGFLVDADHAEAFAKAIEEIHAGANLAADYGDAGYRKALSYSAGAVSKTLLDMLLADRNNKEQQ